LPNDRRRRRDPYMTSMPRRKSRIGWDPTPIRLIEWRPK
jgi:hypothetical protein